MFFLMYWVIFGLIVGSIAKWFHPGEDPIGWLPTIGIGIAGSFTGGMLHSLIYGGSIIASSGMIWSIIGGVILCYGYSFWKTQQK